MEESLLEDDDDFVGDGEFLNPKLVFVNVFVCCRECCFSRTIFGEEETHEHEDDIVVTTAAQNCSKERRFSR